MPFLSAKVLDLDVSHLIHFANGILQTCHNDCGRGIAPYVYRGAELIQDPVDGQLPGARAPAPEGLAWALVWVPSTSMVYSTL